VVLVAVVPAAVMPHSLPADLPRAATTAAHLVPLAVVKAAPVDLALLPNL
jgi:hypothetical protein